MRGTPSSAPYSPREIGTGLLFPAFKAIEKLSGSTEMQTATRAPLGHVFGVSLRPARTWCAVFCDLLVGPFQPGLILRGWHLGRSWAGPQG